jgi:hypothetical protein
LNKLFSDENTHKEALIKVAHIAATVLRSAQERSERDGHSLLGLERWLGPIWKNALNCWSCHLGMKMGDSIIAAPVFMHGFESVLTWICHWGMNKSVCEGMIVEMTEIILPELVDSVFSPKYFCSRVVGTCANPHYTTLRP